MTRSATLEPSLPRLRAARLAWLFALAVAAAIAVGFALDRFRTPGPPLLDPAAVRPGFGPATFAEATAQAELNVKSARENLAPAPDEWWRAEPLAYSLIARWRLTGDYADLAEADRLLDRGLAAAPDPAGPVLARALLSGLVHRLDEQEQALARVGRWAAPYPAETADAAAQAGDIALQRGDLVRAGERFAEGDRIVGWSGSKVRLALLAAYRGDLAGAVDSLDAVLAQPRQPPAVLANLMLQRANLAYWNGDWIEAGRWVGAAQRTFPGYWLADAYAAQQFALTGRTDKAIRAYRIVAARSGRPEVMDALAHLLRLQGRSSESRAWAARAAARWRESAALFPEAVAHHRAEHELAVGSASAALAFAQADAVRRPQAPNLVVLARALLLSGRPREARAALDRADAQGWVSANQWMARAEVEAALGDGAAAEAARERALAINPKADNPRARLIWFGHD